MRNCSKKQLREFGIVMGIFFPMFIGWILPFLNGHEFLNWTLFVGIILFMLAILKPSLLSKPYELWISLANLLAWFNSRIILGLVYFFVLIPISIIMKIFGYDPLRLKRNKKNTYREDISNRIIDLERIF